MEKTHYYFGIEDRYSFSDFLIETIRDHSEVFIVSDDNCLEHCIPELLRMFPELEKAKQVILNSGEKAKVLSNCEIIWQKLLDNKADRNSMIVNVGGGVISDMGGFSASLYKRGVDFIHIPTTLLAQVDASIGGKTGVNFSNLKNIIGTFRQPLAIYFDEIFLNTLSSEHLRAGLGEIVKHALIKDVDYWHVIQSKELNDIADLFSLVNTSIRIKSKLIENDPFEKGQRKLLNFGHTVGHALETQAIEKGITLTHGEAVAYGIVCESYLSVIKTGLKQSSFEEISNFIFKNYPDYPLRNDHELIAIMENDKKNSNLSIRMSLLNKIGEASYDIDVAKDEIIEAFKMYNSYRLNTHGK